MARRRKVNKEVESIITTIVGIIDLPVFRLLLDRCIVCYHEYLDAFSTDLVQPKAIQATFQHFRAREVFSARAPEAVKEWSMLKMPRTLAEAERTIEQPLIIRSRFSIYADHDNSKQPTLKLALHCAILHHDIYTHLLPLRKADLSLIRLVIILVAYISLDKHEESHKQDFLNDSNNVITPHLTLGSALTIPIYT